MIEVPIVIGSNVLPHAPGGGGGARLEFLGGDGPLGPWNP